MTTDAANGTTPRPAAIPQPALRGVPARLRDARRAPGGDARAPLGPTDVRRQRHLARQHRAAQLSGAGA
ncbi:hypothetical protein WAI50_21385, partial [Acinetobacter baumannii]